MKKMMCRGFLVTGMMFISVLSFGQGSRFTAGVESSMLSGGDGFGMYLTPAVHIGYNKVAVSAGPLVQKTGFHCSGVQIKPTYTLKDSGYRKVYVYLFTQTLYNRNVYLSETYNQILEKLEPEMIGKERVEFRTIQQYAGVGLSGGNTRRVCLNAEVGIGGYLDLEREGLKVPETFEGTRSNSDISLMFSLGVRFNLIKQVK